MATKHEARWEAAKYSLSKMLADVSGSEDVTPEAAHCLARAAAVCVIATPRASQAFQAGFDAALASARSGAINVGAIQRQMRVVAEYAEALIEGHGG